jgi:hypothetical protein
MTNNKLLVTSQSSVNYVVTTLDNVDFIEIVYYNTVVTKLFMPISRVNKTITILNNRALSEDSVFVFLPNNISEYPTVGYEVPVGTDLVVLYSSNSDARVANLTPNIPVIVPPSAQTTFKTGFAIWDIGSIFDAPNPTKPYSSTPLTLNTVSGTFILSYQGIDVLWESNSNAITGAVNSLLSIQFLNNFALLGRPFFNMQLYISASSLQGPTINTRYGGAVNTCAANFKYSDLFNSQFSIGIEYKFTATTTIPQKSVTLTDPFIEPGDLSGVPDIANSQVTLRSLLLEFTYI